MSKKSNRDMGMIKKGTILVILIVVIVNISMFACAPVVADKGSDVLNRELGKALDEITQVRDELGRTKAELSSTQRELNTVKDKLSETESALSDNVTELEVINSKLAEANEKQFQAQSKYEELSVKYEELSTEYEELKEKYNAVAGGSVATINVEEVEQALFKLINQDRDSKGLSELVWSTGLYSCAQSNNLNMSITKSIQLSECPSLQQVFWFLGYGTGDRIANVALAAWKNNSYSYNQNVLYGSAVDGAVSVYKSEDILYITFLCYTDKPFR